MIWKVVVRPHMSLTNVRLVIEASSAPYRDHNLLRAVNARIISVGGVKWDDIPGRYRNTIRRWVAIQKEYTLDNFELVIV